MVIAGRAGGAGNFFRALGADATDAGLAEGEQFDFGSKAHPRKPTKGVEGKVRPEGVPALHWVVGFWKAVPTARRHARPAAFGQVFAAVLPISTVLNQACGGALPARPGHRGNGAPGHAAGTTDRGPARLDVAQAQYARRLQCHAGIARRAAPQLKASRASGRSAGSTWPGLRRRDARTVVWPNGLDLAPDVLHGEAEPNATLGFHDVTGR